MPIVAVQNYVGDSATLRAKYEQANEQLRRRGPANGVLAHLCFETDSGMCLINVWESVDDLTDAAARSDFVAALSAAELEYIEPAVHPLYRLANHVDPHPHLA